MRPCRYAPFAMLAWLMVPVPLAAEVRLTIDEGVVSLSARDATLREIFEAWARVGQTTVFNVEHLPDDPVTIELADLTEERALEVLLRTLNGYIAAPRATPLAGASHFDRIMLMPGLAAPRRSVPEPAPQPASVPTEDDLLALPPELPEEGGDERPVRIVPAPGQRGAVFRAFQVEGAPAPAEEAPPPRPSYGPRPVAAPGVPVPGMIVPTPEGAELPQTRFADP